MAKGKSKQQVSVGFWMLALFLTALPCVGVVFVLLWAFVGENESRKNYFRAVIAWWVIIGVIWTSIMVFGFWPQIQKHIQSLLR